MPFHPPKRTPRWVRSIARAIAFAVFAVCILTALAAYMVIWPEPETSLTPAAESSTLKR